MRNKRRYILLGVGLLLVVSALVLYGIQVFRAAPPIGSTPAQIDQLAQQYGSDNTFIQGFKLFLFLFLLGLTFLFVYGAIGTNSPDNPVYIVPKIVILLVILASVVTTLNSLAVASKAIVVSPPAFCMFLAVAALGLANFAFVLVVWNGFRWGMWAYAISAFIMFVLKFAGSVPIMPSLFELSAVVVLIYLIRPLWIDMD